MKSIKNIKLIFILLFASFLLFAVGDVYPAATKKIIIKSVNFKGNNNFTNQRLYNLILSQPSSFLNKRYYYPEVFIDDLKNIELFYMQNGYLEVNILNYDVQTDTSKNETHISIEVSEGELTRVEGVSVLGNNVFHDDLLRQKIDIKSEDPFLSKKIEEANLALLTFYAENGYLDAEVKPDVKIDTEMHRALIDFNIEEKIQFKIDKIILNGLKKTNHKVVLRELYLHSGDIINYSSLIELQRKIYLTGLFQSVYIRPKTAVNGDAAKKDILIELKENISGEFNVSMGFGSIEKLRGNIEVFNNNISGTARKIGLTSKLSFINRSVEASFTEPRTFNTRWQADANIFRAYSDEPGFDLNRIGGNISFGRKILERSNIILTYRDENVKLSNIHVSKLPDDIKTNIRSLKFSISHDTRDNLFDPNKGIYFEWSNESGLFFSEKNNGFLRFTGRVKYFYPLYNAVVIGSSMDIGWINAKGGLQEIPLHERFYAGGPNSVRGFGYRKLGPLDEENVPIGGRFKFVWNLVEVRRTIYKMIGGVLFSDIGNVWLEPKDFKLNDIRSVFGFGFRVKTPIGLARLDYGINLDKQKRESRGELYFSIGQAF